MVRVHQVHPLERREQPGDAQIEGAARAVQIDRVEQAIARRRAPGSTGGAGRIPGIAGALDCAVFHRDRLSGRGLGATRGGRFSCISRACASGSASPTVAREPRPSDRLWIIAPRPRATVPPPRRPTQRQSGRGSPRAGSTALPSASAGCEDHARPSHERSCTTARRRRRPSTRASGGRLPRSRERGRCPASRGVAAGSADGRPKGLGRRARTGRAR